MGGWCSTPVRHIFCISALVALDYSLTCIHIRTHCLYLYPSFVQYLVVIECG
ncbi:hypothetical protein BD310DRAFT_924620 [Dichomitus squalens]|uniref:Uncharacterized protein n=1 Tax=Dichomitus squalens TaxID=114155 RepID=A0A4Q9PYB5_9APHY|nr:hypothetical protein BD310DRAFT_924620 [Dichomitus squalens]